MTNRNKPYLPSTTSDRNSVVTTGGSTKMEEYAFRMLQGLIENSNYTLGTITDEDVKEIYRLANVMFDTIESNGNK